MKKKLLLLLKSLHPAHSRQLSERFLGHSFSFYFMFVGIGLLIMMAIFIGLNWNKPFDIAELSTNDTIVLVERPLVSLDNQLNETKSFLAFSNTDVSYNKFIFFGKKTKPYVNELTLLLIPGIALLIGSITVIFGLLIALLSSVVGYFSLRKHKTSLRDIMVINLHYQAPVLMIFFILYPFWNYAFLILLLYLFNFVFGILLLSSKKFKSIDV